MKQNGEFKGSTNAKLEDIERRLNDIESNHLPHLKNKLDRIEAWLMTLMGTIITGMSFIILKK